MLINGRLQWLSFINFVYWNDILVDPSTLGAQAPYDLENHVQFFGSLGEQMSMQVEQSEVKIYKIQRSMRDHCEISRERLIYELLKFLRLICWPSGVICDILKCDILNSP